MEFWGNSGICYRNCAEFGDYMCGPTTCKVKKIIIKVVRAKLPSVNGEI